MSSVSLFEQLTSSVSLSILGIVSGAVLVLLLVYTVACRLFFSSSSSKSKDTPSNKEKKSNTKNNAKVKKPVVAGTSSSSSKQSEESENDKATLIASTKKSIPPNKASAKQQGPVRAENAEEKKQSKIGTSNKQQASGKSDVITKVNATNPNKKQPVEGEGGSDQEDEGQWVTQGSKQVNNRNRNKGKVETSTTNHQASSSALPNRNIVSEKRPVVPTTNDNISSSINKNESDIEPTFPLIQNPEPIEICQLLPKNENRYTANDNWWKQPLNKQQTFSVDDLGEWPEREQDEQYIVQKKRIVPIKKSNEEQDDNEL